MHRYLTSRSLPPLDGNRANGSDAAKAAGASANGAGGVGVGVGGGSRGSYAGEWAAMYEMAGGAVRDVRCDALVVACSSGEGGCDSRGATHCRGPFLFLLCVCLTTSLSHQQQQQAASQHLATRFGAALKEAGQPLTSSRIFVLLTSTGNADTDPRLHSPYHIISYRACWQAGEWGRLLPLPHPLSPLLPSPRLFMPPSPHPPNLSLPLP